MKKIAAIFSNGTISCAVDDTKANVMKQFKNYYDIDGNSKSIIKKLGLTFRTVELKLKSDTEKCSVWWEIVEDNMKGKQ